MATPDNTFIQLRQKDCVSSIANGDYLCKLKEPITLEQGDQVVVNKMIIDSRSVDNDKILLDNDTEFQLTFCYYLVNYDFVDKYNDSGRTTLRGTSDVDNQYYVFCKQTNISGKTIVELNEISFTALAGKAIRPFLCVIQYTSVDGDTVNERIELNQDTALTVKKTGLSIRAQKLAGEPFVNITPASEMAVANADPSSYQADWVEVSVSGHYDPVLNFHNITLEAGAYSVEDFAEKFTQRATLNDEGDPHWTYTQANGGVSNGFLVSSEGTFPQFFYPQGVFINAEDASDFFYLGNTTNSNGYWLGTSQLALEVDDSVNRFKFTRFHLPYYDSSGNESVIYSPNGISTTDYNLVSSNGGIFLTNVYATDLVTGQEIPFFDKILGFDLGKLCVTTQYTNNATLGSVPYFPDLKVGENVTTGLNGIDVAIKKDNTFNVVPDLSLGHLTNISQTEPIFANGNFTQINFDYGYYLVEIRGLNSNLITNNDKKKHIFGIVSRYYENENYTAGSEVDGIVYRHYGNPKYINELQVRILNGDYELAEDLGDDNSIFLQVLKAPPQEASEKR